MKSLVLSGLFFLTAAAGLFAQEPQSRAFRVISLAPAEDALFYDGKTPAIPLSFQVGALSPEYPAPTKSKLLIYKLVPPPVGEPAGKSPTRVTVAEIDYPADAARVTVLLHRGKGDLGAPYEGVALPDIAEQHGIGKVRIINCSALPGAFAADKTVTQAPSRSYDQFAAFPKGPLELQVAVQAGSSWVRIFSLERNLRPNTRLFAIIADAPPAYEGGPPVAATIVYEAVPVKKNEGVARE
jgi:hypothetical protein